jgi:ATP-dependent DNA helicase RecG
VTPETLRLDLADLVNRGIILRVGAKKGTYYIMK